MINFISSAKRQTLIRERSLFYVRLEGEWQHLQQRGSKFDFCCWIGTTLCSVLVINYFAKDARNYYYLSNSYTCSRNCGYSTGPA